MHGSFSLNWSLTDCVWQIAWFLKQMGAALVFALGLGDLMADIMLRVVTQAAVTLMLHLHFDISPSVKYAAHISLWKWIICGEKTHKKALGSLICWHYWKCLNRTHRQSCSALQCFDCKTKRLTNFLLCTKMVCSLVSTLNLTTSPSWLRYSSSLPGWWDRRQEEKS